MKTKITSAQIWDTNPYLEKVFFLINEFNFTEENAIDVAKLKFKKLSLEDKMKFVRFLNK